MRIGAVWMFLNLIAAVFLGAEFVVQQVRNLIARRHQHHGDSHVASIPSGMHRA
jgi:hypothetical protein